MIVTNQHVWVRPGQLCPNQKDFFIPILDEPSRVIAIVNVSYEPREAIEEVKEQLRMQRILFQTYYTLMSEFIAAIYILSKSVSLFQRNFYNLVCINKMPNMFLFLYWRFFVGEILSLLSSMLIEVPGSAKHQFMASLPILSSMCLSSVIVLVR